eukprot:4063576-Pleurochrysis_carterae.AAC.1
MVRAAMKDPRNLSPNLRRIVTASHSGFQIGEVDIGLGLSEGKYGNITNRGRSCSVMRIVNTKKGAKKIGRQWLRKCSNNMHQAVVQLSGGDEHASTLVHDHAKANPALYKQ